MDAVYYSYLVNADHRKISGREIKGPKSHSIYQPLAGPAIRVLKIIIPKHRRGPTIIIIAPTCPDITKSICRSR